MENEYICFKGNDDELNVLLSEYFSKEQISVVRQSLPLLNDFLNESEFIQSREITTSDNESMGFIVSNEYSINIRKTTLILFAVILDMSLTKGAAMGLLTMTGVASQSIRRLNKDEKKVIPLINAGKISFDADTGKYKINDGTDHGYSPEQLKLIIDKMLDNEIVEKEGEALKIAF